MPVLYCFFPRATSASAYRRSRSIVQILPDSWLRWCSNENFRWQDLPDRPDIPQHTWQTKLPSSLAMRFLNVAGKSTIYCKSRRKWQHSTAWYRNHVQLYAWWSSSSKGNPQVFCATPTVAKKGNWYWYRTKYTDKLQSCRQLPQSRYIQISHRCFLHLSPHPPRSGSKVPPNFGMCHGSEPVHSTELARTLLRAWDLWVLPSSVGVSKWRSCDELPLISGIFTALKAMITMWFCDILGFSFLENTHLKIVRWPTTKQGVGSQTRGR